MFRPLSRKHLSPCPACKLQLDLCRGHDWKAMAKAAANRQRAEEQARVRGTPEWCAANRAKRKALQPKPKAKLKP